MQNPQKNFVIIQREKLISTTKKTIKKSKWIIGLNNKCIFYFNMFIFMMNIFGISFLKNKMRINFNF